MDTKQEKLVEAPGAPQDGVLISVTGLQKSFGAVEVLKGIDIQIRQGDVVVVIGPSGSGKSTLISTCTASAWVWFFSSSTSSPT